MGPVHTPYTPLGIGGEGLSIALPLFNTAPDFQPSFPDGTLKSYPGSVRWDSRDMGPSLSCGEGRWRVSVET